MTKRGTTPDLSEFEQRKRPNGTGFKLDDILDELDETRRGSLLAALAAGYSDRIVADVVTGWGHTVSDSAVRSWRQHPASRRYERIAG